MTKQRIYPLFGEVISPAEEWLIREVHAFMPITKKDPRRVVKRRLLGVAKSLGLYPIPNWWLVRERLLEATRPDYSKDMEIPF